MDCNEYTLIKEKNVIYQENTKQSNKWLQINDNNNMHNESSYFVNPTKQ